MARRLRGRGAVWLAAALLLAVLAAIVTGRAAGGADPGEPVLVARVAIPAGTVLDPATAGRALAIAAVPAGVRLPGLLREPALALGRRTAAALSPGEPITEAALGGAPGAGPAPLARGQRAVPVPLSAAGGAAAGLAPGVRVDVVASTGEGPAGRSAIVVAGAEVLATVASGDPAAAPGPESGSALLRVSARQALRVTAALNFARDVRLLVRPADEGARAPTPAAAAP